MEAERMKNDLTCGVVRDLLPSYVENLLCDESREAVERHLAGCPACTAQKEAMAAPAAEAEETAREVDYLKRVKKRSAKRIVLAVVCTALVLLGCAALKLFVIGTPLQPQSMEVMVSEMQDGGRTLYLSLWPTESSSAFHSWKVECVDGVTSIYARRVLVSPLYSSGDQELRIPIRNVREVWLGGVSGKLLWQDGMVITQKCLDLLELRTPYCGDAPALGAIAEALALEEIVGPYSMEIKTSYTPYRWTLRFENTVNDNQRNYMTRCEYLMLALVDNLDSVRFIPQPTVESGTDILEDGTEVPWTSTVGGNEMTLDSADRAISRGGTSMNGDEWKSLTEVYNKAHGTFWKAKTSVKDYTRSPADFQRLMAVLDYWFLEGGRDQQ